ncbi:unnamed protein product [Ectocarpus fasciculatus]
MAVSAGTGTTVSLLCGATVSMKDNFSVLDDPVTAGSKILQGYVAPYDSTIAERVKQNKGILLGRTNMDEHGMGSSSANSAYGPVVNPWTAPGQRPLSAGGSSGGASALVAAGVVDVSIGSDTGGSVRQPASFCGLVGMKPSYGFLPRHGLLSYASSLDCPGIIAASTLDTAIALDSLTGSDSRDPTAIPGITPYTDSLVVSRSGDKFEKYCKNPCVLAGVNIGIPDEFSVEGLDPSVLNAWEETIRMLVEAGAKVRVVSLPSLKLALPCYYVLACAEASSNLSRYDGIRYGYRHIDGDKSAPREDAVKYSQTDQSADAFFRDLTRTRAKGFGPEVVRRILTGTYVLSQSAYHDYFETAARCRSIIHEEIRQCLSGAGDDAIHALVGPTAPHLPFVLGASADPANMLLGDLYTIQANLAGIPAVSLPVDVACIGSDNSQPVPIGMQFLGRYRDEARLLKICRAVESRTDFVSKIPEWLQYGQP